MNKPPRFQVGDEVRVVRILTSYAALGDDMSDETYDRFCATYLGNTYFIKRVTEPSRDSDGNIEHDEYHGYTYSLESGTDTIFEEELDYA